ncbi:MAG: UDP-N-acetyl-D-glucosamine dehydrogenase, partial [Marinosulfonomonas sp.]|nr:UDP-N-acetyl-D-glucosamine dehydrogenase [Marinosulfonomonas sp.]
MSSFIERINDQTSVVGILGMGYVGIPLAISMARAKCRVLGFDISQDRIDTLNSGKSPVKH